MEKMNKDRRRLLQGAAALLGGGTALAFASSASAWDVQPMQPGSAAGRDYANRCGGPQEHAGLIQQLRTALAADPALASTALVCPICGCPVTVSR